MPRRHLLTPTRSVLALVLLAGLVVGGLAWVSVSALQAEADRLRAAAEADAANRQHLALWRLDSHMLAPLGVENNRPFTNYAALAAPAPVVLDDAGLPAPSPGRVPSPLLAAALPNWMLLHFEVDGELGWRSPQVLSPTLARTLAAEPLSLPLTNCTLARGDRLAALRAGFPLAPTLAALAALEPGAPFDALYLVAVPLADHPAVEKPAARTAFAGRPAAGGLASVRGFEFDRSGTDTVLAKKNDGPTAAKPQPNPGDPAADWMPAPRTDGLLGRNPLPTAPATVLEVELSAEAKARNRAFGQMQASRAGGYEPPVFNPPGLKARPPAGPEATAGVKPPSPADDWTEKVAKSINDRSQQEVEKQARELAEQNATRGGDVPKGTSPTAYPVHSPRALAGLKPGDPTGLAAVPKSAPVVVPATATLSPLRARWVNASDGTRGLWLVRTAFFRDRPPIFQGVVIDWPTLRNELTALVTGPDLFPNAELAPLDGTDLDPETALSTLPVRLVSNDPATPTDPGFTPLRVGLTLAWAAAVLAIAAVAVGGRAALAMSERRMRFASAVTHELRTPLTALQLHLDLLTSGLITDEEKKAEYLATLAAEADRLNRLVENVLDFARLEKSSALALARPVPVADLIDSLEQTWADRLRGEGFEWVTEVSTRPDQTVTVDRRVLEQVLGNLIDNARKYAKSAADRRIRVRVTPADRRVAIEVIDGGPGVPAGEHRTIFKPFRRGSTSTDTGGVGLGLSLAKEWAELFGGGLTYRPADGGGACFRLELPG